MYIASQQFNPSLGYSHRLHASSGPDDVADEFSQGRRDDGPDAVTDEFDSSRGREVDPGASWGGGYDSYDGGGYSGI